MAYREAEIVYLDEYKTDKGIVQMENNIVNISSNKEYKENRTNYKISKMTDIIKEVIDKIIMVIMLILVSIFMFTMLAIDCLADAVRKIVRETKNRSERKNYERQD